MELNETDIEREKGNYNCLLVAHISATFILASGGAKCYGNRRMCVCMCVGLLLLALNEHQQFINEDKMTTDVEISAADSSNFCRQW